jgi:hypothetical protein
MEIRKLRKMGDADRPSAGITLPKEDLQEDGVVDERGEIADEYVKIEREGDGKWSVELVDA